jgi:hypothetical protein
VALCIAADKGYETRDDAKAKALRTLQSLNGQTDGFTLAVWAGFASHFVNAENGSRVGASEYSTVDTAIMVCGALFAKKYFSESIEIAALADQLYQSVTWENAFNADANIIYREVNQDTGAGQNQTTAYNEYMLVAYLASKAANSVKATTYWNAYYHDDPTTTGANVLPGLPRSTYKNIDVLTDHAGNYLSSFIPQFNYYLINHFTTSDHYKLFFTNALLADKAWWATLGATSEYGFVAGASPVYEGVHGYKANKINDNPYFIVSPYIMAGFIPVDNTNQTRGFLEQLSCNRPESVYPFMDIGGTSR